MIKFIFFSPLPSWEVANVDWRRYCQKRMYDDMHYQKWNWALQRKLTHSSCLWKVQLQRFTFKRHMSPKLCTTIAVFAAIGTLYLKTLFYSCNICIIWNYWEYSKTNFNRMGLEWAAIGNAFLGMFSRKLWWLYSIALQLLKVGLVSYLWDRPMLATSISEIKMQFLQFNVPVLLIVNN